VSWWARFRSRRYRPTGTLFGNPSVLDDVKEDPLAYSAPDVEFANPFPVGEEAVRADIARDMDSLADDVTNSEERLFDFFERQRKAQAEEDN